MAGKPLSSKEEVAARQAPRFTCEVPTTCQPPSSWSKQPWPATIRDISTTGLGITLARRFERGSGLAVELPAEDGTTSTVLGRVARVQPLGEGLWLLGLKFISELSDEEVRGVLHLDPIRHATLGSDAPTAAAPSVNGVLFQARLDTGETARWFVRRLELSGTWPLPANKVISLRARGLSQQGTVELRVRQCKLFGSYWIIDCRFAQAPDDALLAALAGPPALAQR